MVRVINISTSGDFVMAERVLGRVRKQLPAMTIRAMIRWGKILEKDMKNSVRQVSNSFTGSSQGKGIEWRQGPKSPIGFLFMRQYLLALDHADPHFVSVRRSRTILLSWAKQARSLRIKRKARMVETGKLKRFGLYVKPHPFISNGWNRARPKLKPILNKNLEIAIKS